MFVVWTTSPLDSSWEERDRQMDSAAGRPSDSSQASFTTGMSGPGLRERGWVIANFVEAVRIKNKLNNIDKVRAMVREA